MNRDKDSKRKEKDARQSLFRRHSKTSWWTHQERQTERQKDGQTVMEADNISSALFNQTDSSGGEEMAAVCFTAATIDLHCSLFQSVTIWRATNNL